MTAEKPELIREIIVELDMPVEYAYKGEMQIGSFITLKAPTGKQMVECADLKQAFFQAISSQTATSTATVEGDEKSTLSALTGDTIMALIAMSSVSKLSSVLVSAKELFANGVAFMEGETKLTKPMLDMLNPDDLERMIGDYYLNFILASWLQKQQKNL